MVPSWRDTTSNTPECLAIAPDGTILLGSWTTGMSAPTGRHISLGASGRAGAYHSCSCREENIYVADAGNRVVLRFDYDGALQARNR